MSGILGIWNLDGRPVEREVLSKMSATIAHRGPDGEGQWIEGPVGLACQLMRVTPESMTETQPLVHPSGAVVVFDGRLDNREEILGHLKGAWGAEMDSPDPALILAAYEAFGDRLPERINGDFALAIFDPRRRQLMLARDAIGVRPLYYHRTGDTFIFTSEIKAILAHPQVSTRPNDVVLAKFLISGFNRQRENLTCFEDIYSLPPCHLLIYRTGSEIGRQYWDFDPARQVRFRSIQDYIETCRHLFEQAVRRRLRSTYPVAIAVSGGLDSSSNYCMAHAIRRAAPDQCPQLFGLSFIHSDGSLADETAFLSEIERYYPTILRIPATTGFINGCRKVAWYTETPMWDDKWECTHKFRQLAQIHGARMHLSGEWGDDATFDMAYLQDLLYRGKWVKVARDLAEIPRWYTDAHPRAFWRGFLEGLVRAHVPATLLPLLRKVKAQIPSFFPNESWDLPFYTKMLKEQAKDRASDQPCPPRSLGTFQAESLYHVFRSRQTGFFLECHNKSNSNYGLEVAFPFTDRDLVSFMMAIPGEVRTLEGIPRGLFRRAMRGILPEAVAGRRSKGEYSALVNESTSQAFQELSQILNSECLGVQLGYLNKKALAQKLDALKHEIHGRDICVSGSLIRLLAFEVWLEVFYGTFKF
jgi:asparagine synthase (glutamine-hydrolysing)